MNEKKRLFVKNPDSGPSYYCGNVGSNELCEEVANIVMAELEDLLSGHLASVHLTFDVQEMTDEEVAALPDA